MKIGFLHATLAAASVALFACGGSIPPPNENLAAAEAASRSAKEVGAESHPQASLYLKMANDQIKDAKDLMSKGDNDEADRELVRAKVDAELSLQIAKQVATERLAEEAQAKVRAAKAGPGPVPATNTTAAPAGGK